MDEVAGRHDLRDLYTLEQMVSIASDMVQFQLRYKDLVRPNGLVSGARVIA